MYRIAVLLTCFNRKEKTLKALACVHSAHEKVKNLASIHIYLTDDGSTDGTGEAVKSRYQEVHVLQGNGELYWAGGMRNSWKEALKGNYDFYLLLNDDTDTYESFFKELLETHAYCLQTFKQAGIYVGSTIDGITNKISYGGNVFTNRFLGKYIKVVPNEETPQECELGNANIQLVHKDVVKKVGVLSEGFYHGLADFDYTLKAKRAGIPVLVTPNILGVCTNDHNDPFETLHHLSLKERVKKLYNPIGLDFRSNLQYMKRNFIYRLPLVFLTGWIKVLFPKFYYNKLYKTRLG
ncbi:MAG: glycosyltransferase family 2 protein [Maribacter sp.]|uniref:glycosyltransferase family 2 protein n=1 Tax=Maribacter sp. TaxID=1897614 RepID=UPI00329A6A2D